MKKATFFLIFIMNLFYSQKCQLDYYFKVDNDSIKLVVKNNDSKKVKVPNTISKVFFQLRELEKLDEEANLFIKQKVFIKDINCPECNKKLINLKKGKSHTYSITQKDLLKFNNIEKAGKYRARMYADIIEFPIGCGIFESEWIEFEIK